MGRVCSIYNLSYDALYRLKKKYPANFDPISLLNEDFSIRNSSVVTLSSKNKSTPDTSKLSSLTTTSKPSTTTNDQIKIRRKPFSQTTAKNQRKVVSELSSSISRYTFLSSRAILRMKRRRSFKHPSEGCFISHQAPSFNWINSSK